MTLRDLWFRVRALLRPGRSERDLRDELRSHLEFEIDKLVRAGVPARDARTAALARFGSVTVTADACRDAWGVRQVHDAQADLRFALRQFRRMPVATTAMAAVLAIGIGFSTAIFVLISSLTSAPLAGVSGDDDVVRIRGIDRGRGPGRATGREFSYGEVLAYASRSEIFRDIGAWTSTDVVLDLGDSSPNLQSGAATFVTGGYFTALEVRPVRGVALPASLVDRAAPQPIGVISHAIWERFYNRSEAAIGRTLKVNDAVITIAGVAPAGFVGARAGGSVMRVWLPLNTRPVVQPSAPRLGGDAAVFGAVARLHPGVSREYATTAATAIADLFARRAVEGRPPPFATDIVPVRAANYFPPSGEPSDARGRLLSLMMPLLVLLITCTSVSALLAGQALARRQEMAVRLAMGADRRRIVRQLLTESGLLGLFAAALALSVLWWMLAGAELAILGSGALLVLDWRAVAFAAGLAMVASVAFGLSPALHATRATLADVLKAPTAHGRTRLQATLVVAQIAFTQPALLMMGTLLNEVRTVLGAQMPGTVPADRLIEVGFNTNPRYGSLDERREDTIARVSARVAALPGIVGAVTQELGGSGRERVESHRDDRTGGLPGVLNAPVVVWSASDGYFGVMGLAVAAGRSFGDADRGVTDVAIVNRELARRLWGETPPVGRRLRIVRDDPDPFVSRTLTIVGVVTGSGTPTMYRPPTGITSHLVVRTHGPADAALPAIREAAFREAPDMPVTFARTRASVEAEAHREMFRGVLAAGGSAAVALTLAAVGLYAVVAVAVAQRRREIGVRAALGADQRRITTLFMTRGLRLCLAGVMIGLGASVMALRILAGVQGQPLGPGLTGLVAGVTAFVMTVALVATWIPARRAAVVDPLAVLRAE